MEPPRQRADRVGDRSARRAVLPEGRRRSDRRVTPAPGAGGHEHDAHGSLQRRRRALRRTRRTLSCVPLSRGTSDPPDERSNTRATSRRNRADDADRAGRARPPPSTDRRNRRAERHTRYRDPELSVARWRRGDAQHERFDRSGRRRPDRRGAAHRPGAGTRRAVSEAGGSGARARRAGQHHGSACTLPDSIGVRGQDSSCFWCSSRKSYGALPQSF